MLSNGKNAKVAMCQLLLQKQTQTWLQKESDHGHKIVKIWVSCAKCEESKSVRFQKWNELIANRARALAWLTLHDKRQRKLIFKNNLHSGTYLTAQNNGFQSRALQYHEKNY